MSDELKPVRCGCGGGASCYFTHYWGKCFTVQCSECGIETKPYGTEDEAIEAWNNAMGAKDINVPAKDNLISRQDAIKALGDAHFPNYGNAIMVIQELPSVEPKERTANVVHSEIFGEWKNMCGNCFEAGKKMGLFPEQKYCYECGCRLEWK